MATKKAQSKGPAASQSTSSSGNDMGAMWKWLYVGGVVVAGLAAAAGFTNNILTWVLILVGILLGVFYFDTADFMNFGLRYLIISAVAGALTALPAVGPYLTGFFGGFVSFLGPIVLTMAVMFFWKKYFGSM